MYVFHYFEALSITILQYYKVYSVHLDSARYIISRQITVAIAGQLAVLPLRDFILSDFSSKNSKYFTDL